MAYPSTVNFNCYRGDSYEMVVRPKSSNNSAFPLTGYTASFTIANRRGSTGTQYAASATVSTGNNTITCSITPAVGRTLNPGTYVYDVQITNGTLVYTVLTGTITVTDDVTGAVS